MSDVSPLLGGKYRVLRVLGEGGMGSVYEAEHTLTQKRVAIKRVHPYLLGRDGGSQRALQEARVAARIRHRHVVDVYDVISEGDSICLVMELLVGKPLSEFVKQRTLEVHEFIRLLLPALLGVAAAHAAGVVHRDLKPENIFLIDEGQGSEPYAKVIDFGISKVVEPGGRITRSGVTIGTPRYAAFEQVMGSSQVDGRADVYALGVMLYEALTGRTPYNADTFGQQAVCFTTMTPLRPRELRPQVPEELERVVMQAIARDREQRFATVQALHAALLPFAQASAYTGVLHAFPSESADTKPSGDAVPGLPLSTPGPLEHAALGTPPAMPVRSTRPHAWLSITLVALVALGGAWWYVRSQVRKSPAVLAAPAQPSPAPASAAHAAKVPPPELTVRPSGALPPPDARAGAEKLPEPHHEPAAKARRKRGTASRPSPGQPAVATEAQVGGEQAHQTHRAGTLRDDQF